MAETYAKKETLRRLSELLAEGDDWSLRDRLLFVQRLALQVRSLHDKGRTHRAIRAESVTVDQALCPHLVPIPEPLSFGGGDADPELCPPELAQGGAVDVPEQIEAAAAAFAEAGHALDPRRIDVYQLGTLLCRLLTGESVLAYLYSPTAHAKVPAFARSVLERAVGYDAGNRLQSCDELIAALDEAVGQAPSVPAPAAPTETPACGSVAVAGETPPRGSRPASTPEAAETLPFTRLGHFEIVRLVGGGGMGDVYRGYDASLDRPVAIKVLPPELARDEDYVRRFHAEAAAAAKIAHPNVVPVHFIGEDAGYHFFAMQFIDGESLSDRLKRRQRLPLDEALEVIQHCLAGLKAAHARGLIHRDIKPGNILLERETGRAMLVDFGLVRTMGQAERMTATGMVMGTVDYIAPEQARGLPVDGRADLYALGVLTYQLLAGRLPFEAETPTAMIFQHAYEEPFPLGQAAPALPKPVIDMVVRMMAKDPAERYSSAEEVLADIVAFREGRPLAVPAGAPASSDERESTVVSAPEMMRQPELPDRLDELVDDGPLRRARDWAATMFRHHAPQFVKDLQNTTQQVDGAVAEYERRRGRLAKLAAEARAIASELSRQIAASEQAAAVAAKQAESADGPEALPATLANKRECEESIAALQKQHTEQQRQLEEIELQLGRTDATLARLHSQRDVLKARLQAAATQQKMEGDLPSRPRPRRLLIAAAAGCSILAALLAWLLIPGGDPLPPGEGVPAGPRVESPLTPPPGGDPLPPGEGVPAGPRVESPLTPLLNDLSHWTIEAGTWKSENGKIIGSGNSSLAFKHAIPDDFVLEWKMVVLGGMRPRINFGGFMVANEGYEQHIMLYHGKTTAEGTRFFYKRNEEMRIQVRAQGEDVQLSVNGETLASLKRNEQRGILTIKGGDGFSPGTTAFYDIVLREEASPTP